MADDNTMAVDNHIHKMTDDATSPMPASPPLEVASVTAESPPLASENAPVDAETAQVVSAEDDMAAEEMAAEEDDVGDMIDDETVSATVADASVTVATLRVANDSDNAELDIDGDDEREDDGGDSAEAQVEPDPADENEAANDADNDEEEEGQEDDEVRPIRISAPEPRAPSSRVRRGNSGYRGSGTHHDVLFFSPYFMCVCGCGFYWGCFLFVFLSFAPISPCSPCLLSAIPCGAQTISCSPMVVP